MCDIVCAAPASRTNTCTLAVQLKRKKDRETLPRKELWFVIFMILLFQNY